MSTINKTYYAIRVGDPRRHQCYLRLGTDDITPELFGTRDDAERALRDINAPLHKIVRIRITTK